MQHLASPSSSGCISTSIRDNRHERRCSLAQRHVHHTARAKQRIPNDEERRWMLPCLRRLLTVSSSAGPATIHIQPTRFRLAAQQAVGQRPLLLVQGNIFSSTVSGAHPSDRRSPAGSAHAVSPITRLISAGSARESGSSAYWPGSGQACAPALRLIRNSSTPWRKRRMDSCRDLAEQPPSRSRSSTAVDAAATGLTNRRTG